ncbi:MAG: tRNA pseudouridine(55) synthase TruB [Cytophagales bacterium]|nr:MAG: tRNA pseudouridine(55) synthase TruB [Cytophagales bacterium]
MNYDFEKGEILLIHKPLEWTSFDVVNKIRYALSKKLNKKIKVGHAGTLDPLATGLLIICTGKMTKQIDQLQTLTKKYEATFCLGATTASYDAETPIEATFPTEHITPEFIYITAQKFIGTQAQIPPIYSAIKVDGKKMYEQARKGKNPTINPRTIEIIQFEIKQIEMPHVKALIHCSKGTYIRSIAYDFGVALQSGAYLSQLERTQIGEYELSNALTIEQFLAQIQPTTPTL